MCGIAGSINSILTATEIDAISHRGPDAQALIQTEMGRNTVFLGHTRLSILDLSEAGNQPMFTSCGKYCIVFNGEIYNHHQLRKRLSHINFKGLSDTETILYYLREYGILSVKDFNGIFAFALLDNIQQKLYLARDQFGVKPLYYYHKENKLIFSSEIKIIKNSIDYDKRIDTQALNSLLTLRYNPAPQTLFEGIKKLEAATFLEFDVSAKVKQHPYSTKDQEVNSSISEKDAIAEYKRLLEQAVERQLLSDVPIGLLLSGGLDSGVLGHLMAKNSTKKIKTFTVGFEGKGSFNELDDARETARYIGADHYETTMNRSQYMNFFYKSFYHTEEPIAEPTIPALYMVSKLASEHVKVVLSGQGADEPMAGYKRYKGEKFLADNRWLLKHLPLSFVSKIFPNNSAIERGVYASQFKEELDRFMGIYTLFTPLLKEKLFRPDFLHFATESSKHLFSEQYDQTDPNADSLSKLLFMDTRKMLPDNLLLFNDKITMANSIENRVPYLDKDLIDFVESVPIHLKLNGNVTKYIHRKAATQWLPPSIINRKKRAFETPVGDWFKNELSDTLIQLIDSSNSFSRIYFNVDFIKYMISKNMNYKKDYKKHLFIILSLELWHKEFYMKNAEVINNVSIQ